MKKTFAVVLITIVVGALIYAITLYMPLNGFGFAWSTNFLLMIGAFTFTETYKVQLESPYFEEKDWERRGKLYTSLGINFYRKLLVWVGWEKNRKKTAPVKKDLDALTRLHYHTKQSEVGHLVIFIIVLGITGYVSFVFGIVGAIWLIITNILLNLYPVFLQRYNRPRIERAMKLSQLRK
ncbi:hypothetical protein MKQ68_11160 [Chitinophaga horti]|uniref:Glycosyl-4,4'-diaponeurosporenoate acyltransferase n=1 Tax=Chitinophaga horti TaxID=2920382 RepID=A0ABY6J7L1_9BACT|nr:hypothetical protein [Chitinophaga horti]UYQ95661.1 hypothetical protein MKQ68_11160 [Chitinophaga horti]